MHPVDALALAEADEVLLIYQHVTNPLAGRTCRLIYIVTRDGISNLRLQPVEEGEPKRLTDFKSEVLKGFKVSRGDDILCSRSYTARDIIKTRAFR